MAKMGRPRKDFDWELLDKILKYKPSLSDTAELMKCSEDTVEIRIKEKHKITFSAYRDKKMATVRQTIIQKAIQMAMNGCVPMMIFTLKNFAGWADNPNADVDIKGKVIQLSYSLDSDKKKK